MANTFREERHDMLYIVETSKDVERHILQMIDEAK